MILEGGVCLVHSAGRKLYVHMRNSGFLVSAMGCVICAVALR